MNLNKNLKMYISLESGKFELKNATPRIELISLIIKTFYISKQVSSLLDPMDIILRQHLHLAIEIR